MPGEWPDPPNYYDAPNRSHKVILQTPQYPVIFPEPTVSQVVDNMRWGHWYFAGGMALAGYGLGYWKGSSIHWQRPASRFGFVFMGQFGLLHMMQDSAYRLMGYKENEYEQKRNIPRQLVKERY
uniref:NADH-ubiquinone oxidoreductase 21kDa subunit N-terminal domain-containing protein n=1 Tax=Chlamydomonas euryale TaxID=1486919 RepID=A0A7R9V4R5_9CHLO|mmetsp:Transcript_18652/g.55640  ORF Transcript_18652/g.55640 Transcript_18652/m.55640 type:complete len:124 (+) Transcript_18652:133-504(+)